MLLNRLSQICLSGMFRPRALARVFRQSGSKWLLSNLRTRTNALLISWFPRGGRLRATNLTLAELIREAYQIKYYQLAGGPGWLDSDCFNVEAKGSGQPTRKDVMAMLQQLLLERFQLKLRRAKARRQRVRTRNREPRAQTQALRC